MERGLALKLLGLGDGASRGDIEQAHQLQRSELEDRVRIAPTRELRQVYGEAMKRLDDARASLLGEPASTAAGPPVEKPLPETIAVVPEAPVASEPEAAGKAEPEAPVPPFEEPAEPVVPASELEEAAVLEESVAEAPEPKAEPKPSPQREDEVPPRVVASDEGHALPARPPAALSDAEVAVGFFEGQILFGRYEVHKRLGIGPHGAVYAAYDKQAHREIVLKAIFPWLLQDLPRKARFAADLEAATKLSHAAIAQTFRLDVGSAGTFVSSEFVRGRTLRDIIDARRRARETVSVDEAVHIGHAVAAALEEAHKLTAHGDLKPENVIVGTDKGIKIRDFGMGQLDGELLPSSARLADIRALAAILYEMLTGQLPGPKPPALGGLRRDVPEPIARLVDRALSDAGRPPSLAEFVAVLQEGKSSLWSKRSIVVAAVAVVGAALGALLVSFVGGGKDEIVPAGGEIPAESAPVELVDVPATARAEAQATQAALAEARAAAERTAAAVAAPSTETPTPAPDAEATLRALAVMEAARTAIAEAEAEAAFRRTATARSAADAAATATARSEQESQRSTPTPPPDRTATARVATDRTATAVAQAQLTATARAAGDSQRTATARAAVVQAQAATATAGAGLRQTVTAAAELRRTATALAARETEREATARAELMAQRTAAAETAVVARRTATARAEAEAATRRQAEEAKGPLITSLNARVAALRFYEKAQGSRVPEGQREYATKFKSSKTRSVFWELSLVHPPQGRRRYFNIRSICYREDGSVFGEGTLETYIEANWAKSSHTFGWGFAEAGLWESDTYRVDIFVDGQKVVSDSFRVYEGLW